MKTPAAFPLMRRFSLCSVLAFNAFLLSVVPSARAGLTVDVHLYHNNYGYYFYPWLNTNTNLPGFPDGNYQIASPQIPTGGSQLQYQATNGTLNGLGGGGNYYGDFDSFLYGITNGQWSITVANSTSTNLYFFTVQVTGLTSNLFGPPPQAVYPASGQINVPNQPTMQWTGPSWAGTLNVEDDSVDSNGNSSYVTGQSLSPDATSWTPGVVLPNGTNQFSVTYQTNVTALITASQPTNSSGQPISAWTSTATLEADFADNVTFVVGSSQNQSNLLVNGGFETGDFTDWTLSGGGDIYVDDGSDSGTTPHSGNYEAEFGTPGELGYISQTLPTTPGATYLLSFWLNSPDGDTPNEFAVSWNGATLFDETNLPAFGWTNLQFVVTATGTSTVLQFGGQDDPSYLALDDVNVTPAQTGGQTLVAHYTFDDANNLGADSSGNGYDLNYNGGNGVSWSGDTQAGSGAAYFDGESFFSYNSTPANIMNTLAGDFSLSFWINTTQDDGNEGEEAYSGVGIVAADVPGPANDLVPAALDGGEVGFNTGGAVDDTLNTSADINDGNYHHIVITRSQGTGQKKIYIDGVLNNSDIASMDLLNAPRLVAIGCQIDASQGNPANADTANYFQGLLDDLQLYSVVLTSGQVAQLYANPGSIISTGPSDFNGALNTTNLTWSTSGDTSWFVETTNTYNGSPSAAQSGSVINSQASVLSVTVNGPGTLTFAWSSIANDPNSGFDYEFDIDGSDADDLYGNNDWSQEMNPSNGQPYVIPAGQHTLTWTTYANGDTDPTEAGFLDNVSFQPDNTPTITLNPFDQTNCPGYPVWLSADADSNPQAIWQWYKVGQGSIPNATSSYFIPTNSGDASVAGYYYAIADNSVGSATTTTAAVTFVTAPLPPDWSIAFKSPFQPVDDTTVTKDYYYGCIVDTNGNLYVAAEFGGNTTVGSSNLNSGTSGDAAAIVKQSPTGSPLWAVGITNNGDGSSYSYGECVAPAPDGGVYLSGNFYGTNWLGTNQLTDNGGGDIFIARFDANGSNLWVKTFGSTNSDFQTINTLASDPAGNVTFVGLLNQGPVTIGTNNYFVVGQQGVLVQLDQTGAVRWSQLLPSEKPLHLTYAAGRLYTSFNTETSGGTTNMVAGTISNLTDRAWAVACLDDTKGDAIWLRGVGGISGGNAGVSLIDDVPRLAVSGGNLFVIGTAYGGSAAFGPLTVYFNDSRGQYFARYDTNGNAQVATTFGSPTTEPLATVANATGVYVTGNFDEAAFFGNNLIGAPSNTIPYNGDFGQAFVAKFDTNGNPLWAREAVSPATVNLLGIALASDGVWASGWTLSALSLGIESTAFGTNNVFSDRQYDYFGGAGGSYIIYWNPGGVLAEITDSALAASPVTLLNPLNNGANFQFQFLSQSGFSHNILYSTNLAAGIWQTNSTVTGDGSVKTITLPFSLFSPAQQGFIRVSTQ